MVRKLLRLDLDELDEKWLCEYSYGNYVSKFDLYGAGHSITIRPQDREAFLNDYANQFRDCVGKLLEDWEEDDDED